MVVEVVAVCTLVAKIASTIGSFEKVLTTCAWLKKVASTEWKKELDKYIEYLQVVKEVTGRYGTSNCSETAITGALQLLDGELTESWSKVDKWIQKKRVCKQLSADDFIKEMKSSRTTIDQNLQLFSTAVQTCRDEERNPARPQTQQAVPQEGNPARPRTGRNDRMPQKKKEFEEQEKEKEREENEYKAWLKKNIAWLGQDSWTMYSEREQCLREQILQLLKEVFEIIAERFPLVPEPEMETE